MSLDSNTLVKAVKSASVDAVKQMKPMAFTYGEVISVSPLHIQVDQKMFLSSAQLILTNAVRDYSVYATVDHASAVALGSANIEHSHDYDGGTTQTGGAYDLTHSHAYSGKKKFTFHFGLAVGEKVMLLRCDGGQKFIVLDRAEAMK